MNIGLYSYAAACVAYSLLAFALVLVWRNRTLSLSAIIATVLTAAWAAVIAAGTLLEYPPVTLIQAMEVARNAAWVFLLLATLGARLRDTDHWLASRRWLPWFTVGLALIAVLLFAIPVVARFASLPQTIVYDTAYSIWLAMAVLGMLLLEQIYRNSHPSERWNFKYLILGLGFMFAYDFFLYTEALLLRQIDPVMWQARGAAVALTAPLLAIAVARSRKRNFDLQLSRHVVFHTFTMLAAGLYLIFMAAVGYSISYWGGTWAGVLEITFLSASGLALLVLLFSGHVRARTRVWLSKNFFSYKYDYRREWLEFTQTLAEGGDDTPRAITQAMGLLADSRAGLLWARLENDNFELVDHWQMEAPVASGDMQAFAQWLEDSQWTVDVAEWRQDPEMYDGLELPGFVADIPGSGLIVPLMFNERLQGILLLHRPPMQPDLNWEDRDLLKVAGRQAASHLGQYQANQSLVEMRQFETFNRLSAYVTHDLKNILAQQSLIVSNAGRHRHNPEFFDDVIDTVSNSVERMTRLMEQMRTGVRGGEKEAIDLCSLLHEVVVGRRMSLPHPVLECTFGELWVQADREQLATVFGHLVQNAQEATGKGGHVGIQLQREGGQAVAIIEDDGVGMDEEFIAQRLFKPFDSTKGLTGMGVGAFESREFVRDLGGDLQVSSTPGAGSRFRLQLPCLEEQTLIPHEAGEQAVG